MLYDIFQKFCFSLLRSHQTSGHGVIQGIYEIGHARRLFALRLLEEFKMIVVGHHLEILKAIYPVEHGEYIICLGDYRVVI